MISVPDPFDLPATPERLRRHAANGLLDQTAFTRALKLSGHVPPAARWAAALNLLTLALGAGLVVAGILFFFAFNWAGMHRFVKLGLLEAAVAGAAGLAFWLGLERLEGKIALLAASGLVGGLLAVFGQVYQTGADAYQLFLLWAGLISGWVLVSRFTPLWMLWLGLLNLTIWLYAAQELRYLDGRAYAALFALNAGGLIAWEAGRRAGIGWLGSRWAPRVLAALAVGALVAAIVGLINGAVDPWRIALVAVGGATAAALLYGYGQLQFDAWMLIVAAFGICVCVNAWLLESLDFEALGLFVTGGLVIGQTSWVVAWIRRRALLWEGRTV